MIDPDIRALCRKQDGDQQRICVPMFQRYRGLRIELVETTLEIIGAVLSGHG